MCVKEPAGSAFYFFVCSKELHNISGVDVVERAEEWWLLPFLLAVSYVMILQLLFLLA